MLNFILDAPGPLAGDSRYRRLVHWFTSGLKSMLRIYCSGSLCTSQEAVDACNTGAVLQ